MATWWIVGQGEEGTGKVTARRYSGRQDYGQVKCTHQKEANEDMSAKKPDKMGKP